MKVRNPFHRSGTRGVTSAECVASCKMRGHRWIGCVEENQTTRLTSTITHTLTAVYYGRSAFAQSAQNVEPQDTLKTQLPWGRYKYTFVGPNGVGGWSHYFGYTKESGSGGSVSSTPQIMVKKSSLWIFVMSFKT